jgi:sugar lactone lactonase YvrE
MSSFDPRVALANSALLGETPVWSEREKRLYWIDSLAPRIHRFDPAKGVDEVLAVPLAGYLGSIALTADGGFLVLCAKQLLRVAPGSLRPEPIASVEANVPENAPNDGKVDPQGRFWFGTMHALEKEPTGALYSYDARLGLRRHDSGFACANGMAWSPDGRMFYFVDMTPGHILAYRFDGDTGSIGDRRIFVAIDPVEGKPDGICCDAGGGVWVAHWDGWCVTRYDAAGKRTAKVAMPVPRPTCPIFGGPGLTTLFVTSSSDGQLDKAPLSGSLFAWQPEIPGLPVATYAG